MAKVLGAFLVLLAGLGPPTAEAGFRSPESLVRNVYAYYGDRSSDLSNGLPRDPATARQFFDSSLRAAWISLKNQPYDFLVQSPTWKIGAVSISVLRRQFDKTYVAAAFDNNGRAVTLNFILVNGPEGWVISDVESPARFVADVSRPIPKLTKGPDYRLAQEREYASRSFGPSPLAAPSSRHLLIRSLKEGRGAGA